MGNHSYRPSGLLACLWAVLLIAVLTGQAWGVLSPNSVSQTINEDGSYTFVLFVYTTGTTSPGNVEYYFHLETLTSDTQGLLPITPVIDTAQTVGNYNIAFFSIGATAATYPPANTTGRYFTITRDITGDTNYNRFTITVKPAANKPQALGTTATANPVIRVRTSSSTFQSRGTLSLNTLNVTAVNDAPTATSATISTLEDLPSAGATPSVTEADTGDTFTLTIVSQPAYGTASVNLNKLVYTPNADVSGSDTFSYRATDSGGASVVGTATVTITAVNDAPTLHDPAALTINEGAGQQTVTLTGISAGGGESAQTLSVTATSSNTGLIPNPSISYISPTSTGALSFAPLPDQSGSAVITVTVTDNGGTANGGVNTVSQSFTVNVQELNSAPTLDAPADLTIPEDSGQQTVTLTGISAGGGESAQVLAVSAVSGNTTVIPNPIILYSSPNGTGNLRLTPLPDQHGSAVITVTVADSGGTANGGIDRVSQSFSVTVTPVNDRPSATAQSVSTTRNSATAISLSGADPEGSALTYSVGAPAHGTLSGTPPNLSYSPDSHYTGSDSFTFTVNDGVLSSDPATVSITVTFSNVAPVATQQSVTTSEDNATAITLAATDADNDPLAFAIVTGPGHGTLSGAAPNFTYTPAADYNGTDSFTFRAFDGTVDSAAATVSLTITAVNDLPILSAIADQTMIEDSVSTVSLSATDADGDPLSYTVSGGSAATVAATVSGSTLTLRPGANYSTTAPIPFSVTVNDGKGTSHTVSFAVTTVTAVNDIPTIGGTPASSVSQNSSYSFTPSTSDPDGDTLTFSISNLPSWAQLKTNSGTVSGTPPSPGVYGPLTLTVSDGRGGNASLPVFTITVQKATSGSAAVPAAANVSVTPVADVMVNFDSVTAAGALTVQQTSHFVSSLPASYRVIGANSYEVTTTATISGPITLTFAYSDADIPSGAIESELRLLHFNGSAWEDITRSVNPENNSITGETNSLSPFAIVAPADQPAQKVPIMQGWWLLPAMAGGLLILRRRRH